MIMRITCCAVWKDSPDTLALLAFSFEAAWIGSPAFELLSL
jgi:hypothetical protein